MIKYTDIAKANETIKTTNIKGKEYAEVNQRIKAFRMVHPNGTITTDIINIENGIVLMKASITDDEGRLIGTGYAYEKEKGSFINQTSYIENCETSAVGRALGMCGFGIDTSVASAEEVQNAIINQKAPLDKTILAKAQSLNIKLEVLAKYLSKDAKDLTNDDLKNAISQKEKALKQKAEAKQKAEENQKEESKKEEPKKEDDK